MVTIVQGWACEWRGWAVRKLVLRLYSYKHAFDCAQALYLSTNLARDRIHATEVKNAGTSRLGNAVILLVHIRGPVSFSRQVTVP